MTELERDMKERIERLTREIEARNAACKQYAYDVACLTDKVRALQVKMSLMSRPPGGIKFRAGGVASTSGTSPRFRDRGVPVMAGYPSPHPPKSHFP